MKEIKFTKHAMKNISEREVNINVLYDVLENPDFKIKQNDNRSILMKEYFDDVLITNMLLRIIIEETDNETLVVTVYKTSKINKYLKGLI